MISFSGSYDNILDRYRSDFVPWTGVTGFRPTMPMEAVLDVLWSSLDQVSHISVDITNTKSVQGEVIPKRYKKNLSFIN